MFKRLYLLRALKCIALLIPIAVMVFFAQNNLFYHADHSTERVRDFYKEAPNSLDVVILGASDVYNAYSPAYAYEYAGFTSYPYAWSAIPANLYKPALKEILSRQNPQLILIEIDGFVKDQEAYLSDESKLRTFAENIPMSLNRLGAIWNFNCENKLSCVIPFFKYHGDWTLDNEELAERFRECRASADKPAMLKGATTLTLVETEWPEFDALGDTTATELDPLGEELLIELMDFCRQQQLDNVVFVRFPHKLMNEQRYNRFTRANRAGQIIEEYGFPFLNLEHRAEEMLLDFECDFYDSDHMNIYGQLKLTEYLSTLLVDEYGLEPMQQMPENQAHWDACIPYSNAYVEIAYEYIEELFEGKRLQERPGDFLHEMEERIASWDE